MDLINRVNSHKDGELLLFFKNKKIKLSGNTQENKLKSASVKNKVRQFFKPFFDKDLSMPLLDSATTVAHAIQQSVAPVFLLTGVGSILSVISYRLGRIIDRYRVLDQDEQHQEKYADEVEILRRRSFWTHWAISFCTIGALLVCMVIAALFVESERGRDPSTLIAVLFVGAMAATIMGLLCFLREIALASDIINKKK